MVINTTFTLQKTTLVKRVYDQFDVTDMTMDEVSTLIDKEGIDYSADFGFKVKENTQLIFSQN